MGDNEEPNFLDSLELPGSSSLRTTARVSEQGHELRLANSGTASTGEDSSRD
jgi:hypothetical protein